MKNDTEEIIVSIRCLTYNQEPFIRQCLDGFVNQKTTFRFEAIVHDDASTDGTAEIVREYAEKYPEIIKPIFEEKNLWCRDYNLLVKKMQTACTGKYVAFCEGDDFWTDSYKLQKQVDFMESHPEYVMIATNYDIIDRDGKLIEEIRREEDEYVFDDFLRWNRVGTLTVLYRKNCLELYIPPISGLRMGDYSFWLYMTMQGKCKHLQANTSSYRLLTNSASHFSSSQKSLLFELDVLRIRDYYATLMKRNDLIMSGMRIKLDQILRDSFDNNYRDVINEQFMSLYKRYGCGRLSNNLLVYGLKHPWSYHLIRLLKKKTSHE